MKKKTKYIEVFTNGTTKETEKQYTKIRVKVREDRNKKNKVISK